MSIKIQGGGALPPPTATPSASEAQKADEQATALKDIQKKTAQLLEQKGVQNKDAFQTEAASNALSSGPLDKAAAAATLDAQYGPETKEIVEAMFKVRVDPQQALKVQAKLTKDPNFEKAMAPLRDMMAQLEQHALTNLSKMTPTQLLDDLKASIKLPAAPAVPAKPDTLKVTDPPKPTEPPASEGSAKAQTKAQATATANTNTEATAAGNAKTTKTADADKKAATSGDASSNAAAAADAKKTAADAAAAKPKDAAPVKDPTPPPASGEAGASAGAAKDKPPQTPPTPPLPASGEASASSGTAKPVEDADETKKDDDNLADEATLGVDQYGNLKVEPQFVTEAETFMSANGLTPQFLGDYDTTLSLTGGSVEVGAAAGASGPGAPTSGTPPPGGDEAMANLGGGAPSPTGGGINPGEAGANAITGEHMQQFGGTYFAVLGNLSDGDLIECAFIVLSDCIKDINKSMHDAQAAMRVKHKMNDAMRSFLAEYMRKTAHLTNTNVKDPDKMEKVEFQYMEPVAVTNANGDLDVVMVPTPFEQTFAPATVKVPTGESSGDKEKDETRSAEWVYDRSIPPQGKAEAQQSSPYGSQPDGKFIAKTSWTYITAGTVGVTQEMMKTRISTIKQDMEKEMLNVQKAMGLRKQVIENLTKMIKSHGDEVSKIIAQLRR